MENKNRLRFQKSFDETIEGLKEGKSVDGYWGESSSPYFTVTNNNVKDIIGDDKFFIARPKTGHAPSVFHIDGKLYDNEALSNIGSIIKDKNSNIFLGFSSNSLVFDVYGNYCCGELMFGKPHNVDFGYSQSLELFPKEIKDKYKFKKDSEVTIESYEKLLNFLKNKDVFEEVKPNNFEQLIPYIELTISRVKYEKYANKVMEARLKGNELKETSCIDGKLESQLNNMIQFFKEKKNEETKDKNLKESLKNSEGKLQETVIDMEIEDNSIVKFEKSKDIQKD